MFFTRSSYEFLFLNNYNTLYDINLLYLNSKVNINISIETNLFNFNNNLCKYSNLGQISIF